MEVVVYSPYSPVACHLLIVLAFDLKVLTILKCNHGLPSMKTTGVFYNVEAAGCALQMGGACFMMQWSKFNVIYTDTGCS